jgi:hypothetical protein
MEKENKKLRDVARKEYIERVRALVAYVRKLDQRMIAVEAFNRKKQVELEEKRKLQK